MNGPVPPRDIVVFSIADWTSPYWTNSQHMATHFAAQGFRVLFVETVGLRRPRLDAVDAGRAMQRLRRGLAAPRAVAENLCVLSPLTIPAGHRMRAISRVNAALLMRRIRRWLRAGEAPLVWTYHPFIGDVRTALAPCALVYHCVDDIGAVPGVDRAAYETAEAALLRAADHVFVTSPALRERCRALAPGRTHYFPNVADIVHFSRAREVAALPADLAGIPRPRLGYAGALTDYKIDFSLIETIARERPRWQVVLIGDAREPAAAAAIARLRDLPNVHALGWRPYAQLPDYLAGFDVALLPQRRNRYTRAMFPMKFFEYLAAGLPVVATHLPALAEFAALHRAAGDPAAFIAEIDAALAPAGGLRLPLDHPVLAAHSWDARLRAMRAIIGL